LDEAIQGGELFQTIVYNPVSVIVVLMWSVNLQDVLLL
jgi:hypothetical protein